jgi:MoaA/NifB/PqqE/SkfB family radical SAM enzyme
MSQRTDDVISDCQVDAHNIEALLQRPPARYQNIRLDPNNTCNLHCVYCHNGRSDKIIEIETLRQFLATKVLGAEFFQVGCGMEPTLDPRLAEIIMMIGQSPARPRGDFKLQTNGLLLHRHDQGKMVTAGLTHLSVSLDAADPQMQRELRDGMSIKKVLRNIENFRKGAPDAFIEFVSVVTSANIDHMESLVDLALNSEVKRVIFREVLYYPGNDVVDHSRMPALLLRPGEFEAMAQYIRGRFADRIELLFAPNEDLNATALQMIIDSTPRRKPLTPHYHRT